MNFKILKIIFLIFFFINKPVNAIEKIAYIDIDLLLNQSIAGKLITKKIEKKYNNDLNDFKDKETKLLDEEKKIVSQKNVLTEDEYTKKVKDFKNKVKKFNNEKNVSIKKINEIRSKSTNILIKNINPIIEEYAKNNSIDIILSKNTILIARSDLEITDEILKILNDKIKEIKID